jgi:predicted transcriptional regulator
LTISSCIEKQVPVLRRPSASRHNAFEQGMMMAEKIDLVVLTADIVSSYVGNNHVAPRDIDGVIRGVHAALACLGPRGDMLRRESLRPAVPLVESVQPDYLVNLFTGQRFKTLKGTLAKNHGMTPIEYRAYWGLPGNYPMVAPNYSIKRQALAKAAGLGSRIKPGDTPFLLGNEKEEATASAADVSEEVGRASQQAGKGATPS